MDTIKSMSDMPDMSDMSDSDREALIDLCIARLRECFDCVQILASYEQESDSTTHRVFKGRGNWYARTGMAAEFLEKDRATTLAEATAEAMSSGGYTQGGPDDPDTAGEGWKNPA